MKIDLNGVTASARLFRIPSLWVGGSHEREPPECMVSGQVTLEVPRAHLGSLTLGVGQPRAGQADGQPAEQAQNEESLGCAHSAAIFVQADVQALMQLGLDGPVTSAAGQQHGWGIALGLGTGDHEPALASPFTPGPAEGLQLADLGRRDEADLLRAGVLCAKSAPFPPTPVALPPLRDPRRVRRGKVRSAAGVGPPFHGVGLGWP
jgi:hypothetical protein